MAPLWLIVAFLTPFAHYHDFAVLGLPFAMIWKDADRRQRAALVVPWILASAGGSYLDHSSGVLTASVMMGIACAIGVTVGLFLSRASQQRTATAGAVA